MLEVEQVHLYPAECRASDEEAPQGEVAVDVTPPPPPLPVPEIANAVDPRRSEKIVPATCVALVLLFFAGLLIYAGYMIVKPMYVVCDAPTTLWLAGVSTIPAPACNGTFYTQLMLALHPSPLTVQCNLDVGECLDAFHTPTLGQAIPDVFVCHSPGKEKKAEDDGLTCSRNDTSHRVSLSAVIVWFAILVFAGVLVMLFCACVTMDDALRSARTVA
jgi:hypothetical protein